MDHPKLTSSHLQQGNCSLLRHKGMYVMAEPHPDDAKYTGDVDWAAYWCSKTQTSFGPDGDAVGPLACVPGRRCCE
jgi:hypothetical protein